MSGKQALIITSEPNDAIHPVLEALRHRGVKAMLVDPSSPSSQRLSVSTAEPAATLTLSDHERFVINDSTRVWLRRPRMPKLASFRSNDVGRFQAECYRAAWENLYSIPAVWMNPHTAGARLERNKPLQALMATESGLHAIPTVCTDDPGHYRLFVESLGGCDVAVKSPVSWHFDLDDDGLSYGTYTRRLSQDQAMAMASRVANSPVLVQPYVAKNYELRVTVVAGSVFACRIDSQKCEQTRVDWRHYDLESVPHYRAEINDQTRSAVLRFMEKAGLLFAAIDMIVDPDGRHWFVEANPSGQYGWIEAIAGLPITEAIAAWLAGSGESRKPNLTLE